MDATISRQVNEILYGGDANRKALYEKAKNLGYSDNEALTFVNSGGGQAGADAVADAAEAKAKDFVGTLDLKIHDWGPFRATFYTNERGDAVYAQNKINSILDADKSFKKLSALEQRYAKAYAAGHFIATNWAAKSDASDNKTRLSDLCAKLGVSVSDAKTAYNSTYQHGTMA